MSVKRIIELTVREVSGSITQSESDELKTLISKSETNKQIYSDTLETWKKSGDYSVKLDINAEASWESFQQKTKQKSVPKLFTLHPIYKVAATIIIVVGLGLAVFNPWKTVKYSTELGETLEVVLEDQSVITLNELSSLVVAKSFNEEDRKIEFLGEAYFDIAENPDKPFIIHSKNSEIRVLGTTFNVDAKEETEVVEVDVTSGRVSFSEVENQSNLVILTKGMKGTFDLKDKGLISQNFENENFQAWRTNILEFDDLSMSHVIEDIQEYFGKEVSIANQEILRCNFTSSFSEPSINEVLDILSITLDLTFEREGNVFVLSGKGCTEIEE
tara:strand:- start:78564 stop:79553 length:990 start_codon:yes stop_codon:yes gene_type:complete